MADRKITEVTTAETLNNNDSFIVSQDSILKQISKSALLDIQYPVGATYVTSTNENPASWLGGTWVLYDKQFKERYVTDITDFITLESNCSSASGSWARWHDHVIRVYLSFTPTVAITDSTLSMYTLNKEMFGVSSFSRDQTYSSFADGGQVMVCFNITAAGLFTTRDIIVRGSSEASLAVGYSPAVVADIIIKYTDMLDSACDKFFWRRTA